jgi:type I restriction enzyme, S subunit
MQLRAGYKTTAVGEFPNDWELVAFSELFDFRNGVNADKHAYGKGVPFINVLEVITLTHLTRSNIPGRISLTKGEIESYAVKHGDLLFNRTSETQEEIGLTSVYLDNDTVVFGGFVIRARPKRGDLDPIYSGYAFRAPSIRTQIIARGQGAIRANVGQADLKQVLAPLPSLPEQRAIARVLADVGALIEGLDQLITKKQNIRQAAMQRLLTGKSRLPGFTDP